MEQITKKRISVAELRDYVNLSARFAEDIFHNGITLIPKGAEVSSLAKFAGNIEKALYARGIDSVLIELHSQIDIELLEEVIKASESFVKIDDVFARETVEQVNEVYNRISEGICRTEDIEKLVESGQALNKIAIEAPEVMFCLGHVRDSDEYTYVHSLNVSLLGAYIANKMFPDDKELSERISIGGMLHDLGKAKISKEILHKAGRLTDEEFKTMKTHSAIGEDIAKEFGVSDPRVLAVVRGHHEKFCGEGYPDGLAGENIKIEARIAAVADVFDALTARRVYKEPMEARQALGIMMDDARLHFDPEVLRTLLLAIGIYPPGTLVELSDASVGVVVGSNGKDIVRPQVLLKIDKDGQEVHDMKIIDLKGSPLHVKKSLQSLGKIAF